MEGKIRKAVKMTRYYYQNGCLQINGIGEEDKGKYMVLIKTCLSPRTVSVIYFSLWIIRPTSNAAIISQSIYATMLVHINIICYFIFLVNITSPTTVERSSRSVTPKALTATVPTKNRIARSNKPVYNLTNTTPIATKSSNVSLNAFNVSLSHSKNFYSPSTTSAIVLSVNSTWKMQYNVTGEPSRLILTVVHNGKNSKLVAGQRSFVIKSNVQQSDSGMYEVIAQNKNTKKRFYFILKVLVTSNVPLHVHTTNIVTTTPNRNTIQSSYISQGGGACQMFHCALN